MSISELEDILEISENDKMVCPHAGDYGCDDCDLGLDIEYCEEQYENWLLEQTS